MSFIKLFNNYWLNRSYINAKKKLGYNVKEVRETYGICLFCEKENHLFPIFIDICPKCYNKLKETIINFEDTVNRKLKENIKSKRKYKILKKTPLKILNRKVNTAFERCLLCKKQSIILYHIYTWICNKCTWKIAKNEQIINYLMLKDINKFEKAGLKIYPDHLKSNLKPTWYKDF